MLRSNHPQTQAEIDAEHARAVRIIDEAFPRHGTPRSDVFKAGASALLKYLLAGTPVRCPYEPGTVEYDAFYAGVESGKKIYCHTEER
ncbi:MAG: hypothetical protein ABTS22_06435 [Accumulibacter sp.]|uniref:hypothetical protein n=1 Tax=Accumulibacter sp. TaxID=2053492 RepID=UPI003315E4B4